MPTDNPLETAAAPAPAAETAPAPAPAAELSADDQALAAIDEGFTAAAEAPVADAETETPAADPAAEATPEVQAADAPVATTAAKQEEAKPAPDAAVEKEIADLGLKDKTAERFRSMANEIRELAPVKEAMAKAGIKELTELPQLVEHATFGRELYKQVTDTGANAEQYGQALDYLAFVNKANSGDLKAAEVCFNMMQGEIANLARMLGKEVPGIHDPLADHPDLRQLVEDQDMPRDRALETARLRNATALNESSRKQAETRQATEAQQQQAITQAAADLNTLGNELAAIDPHYAAKAPVLVAQLQAIKDALPPGQWVAKARALYATIPAPTVAPALAPARPAPGPIRGSALRQNVLPATDDPMEALEQAFAQR